MNYKINDIVKRARQLADLENSNFISWNENNSLLNESYVKLYTEAINHDDKTFLKTVSISTLEPSENVGNVSAYILPEDFYMLGNVYTLPYNREILRKAKGECVDGNRYDLINNKIIIYGDYTASDIIINYYAAPEKLYTKAPKKVISLPEDLTYLDCNGNLFLGYKTQENNIDLVVYNLENAKTKTVTIEDVNGEVVYGLLGKKTVFVMIGEDSYKVDLVSGVADSTDNIPAKVENNLYFFESIIDDWNIYKEASTQAIKTGIHFATLEDLDFSKPFSFIPNVYESVIMQDTNGYLYEVTEDDFTLVTSITDKYHYTYIGEDFYYVNEDVYKNSEKLVDNNDFWYFVGFNKCDDATGYGVTVITEFDEVTVMSSYTDMTVSFPNNFYFEYVAFMLAINYKIKQNADVSGLTEQANRESFQFYNSLNKDVNTNVRINNVYNGGWC